MTVSLHRATEVGIKAYADEYKRRIEPILNFPEDKPAIENTSGLQPKGWAVLLKPYEPEMVTKSGIIIADTSKQRIEVADQRAVVIAVGPEAWSDEKGPRARPGDKVMITKYGGMFVTGPGDGKQYRIVNDKDVFCQITDEKHEVSYV